MPNGRRDPAEGGPTPEFAQETRIVSFGSELPSAEMLKKLTGGDPIPKQICPRFKVFRPDGQVAIYEMRRPIVILGRVKGIADVVAEDDAVSRYHACVAHRDGRFVLTDMGSTNGTYLNRKPVTEAELHAGDDIRIGKARIVFEIVPRS